MSQAVAENTVTLANLLAAYEGESNAHAKYDFFAAKADAEGWHGAASLFRAAARAEQIHAANHARVIKQLGGEARCEIHAVEVRSTLANLKAALAGEQYEVETMYPGFIADAFGSDVALARRNFHMGHGGRKDARSALSGSNRDRRAAHQRILGRLAVCFLYLRRLRIYNQNTARNRPAARCASSRLTNSR